VLALITGAIGKPKPYYGLHYGYGGYGYQPAYTNVYSSLYNLPANYNPLIPYSVYNAGLMAGHGLPTTATLTQQFIPKSVQPVSQTSFSKSSSSSQKSSLTSSKSSINANRFATAVAKTKVTQDKRIKADNSGSSPSAAAALAYMRNVVLDDLCGKPAEIYLQTIFDGKTKEEANAEATRYYIKAYNGGARLPESGACKASDEAFREAYASGEDPILKSAEAFINAWPGVKDGNPCAVSGIDYYKAIIDGKSHDEANTIAAKRFSKAFTALAKSGKSLKDPACAAATKAFFDALPEKSDPANAAAFVAFIDKLFEDDSKAPAYDPVCLASLEAFLEAYNNGEDLQTANLISARAFFKEFAAGSSVPADSACAAATKAYTAEIQNRPSPPNAAAMIAYINEAIASGNNKLDPVCAASAEAYFDAYIEEKSESAANEAAAVAYLEQLEKTPNFDLGSPCGKAATAYIKEFEK